MNTVEGGLGPPTHTTVAAAIARRLLFVGGKGGVGKTVVSQAIAQTHAEAGRRTLWVTFEDPALPMGETRAMGRNLWHLNCEATIAFEEYAALKIGIPKLTRIFLQNKLMRYLSQAAPGIHELVLLGKVWHERNHYERVVVDMPSTGYGLAMFQSADNFARLFKGGPIHNDAEAMLATFRDPAQTGHLIVALPEEMPLVEALELHDYMTSLFTGNPPAMLVNRVFPPISGGESAPPPHEWDSPMATSALDYARKRTGLEAFNLRLWQERNFDFGRIQLSKPSSGIVSEIARQLTQQGYTARAVTGRSA